MDIKIFTFCGIISMVIAQENAEFLIENAKLCGDPFADPIWIPVLDTCSIECDYLSEYCVENDDLVQQCKKLPDECKKLLGLRQKNQRKQSNFARSLGVKKRNIVSGELQDRLIEESLLKKPSLTGSGDNVFRPLHNRVKRY